MPDHGTAHSPVHAHAQRSFSASQALSAVVFASSSDKHTWKTTAALLLPAWQGRESTGRALHAVGSCRHRGGEEAWRAPTPWLISGPYSG